MLSQRYYSLDVFRGLTVAFMILVNNQMGTTYAPLDHAPWHGLTPTDLVFPFFLFAVGNALSFVMPKLKHAGTQAAFLKIAKRSLLIFLIGLLLNWTPFCMWRGNELVVKGWTWINSNGDPMGVRIMSVLGRIALCYFFGSLILLFFGTKPAIWICTALLLIYWLICLYAGHPGDPYSITGYAGNAIDKSILGEPHMYHGEGLAFDPEGLLSTLPAIVSVVIGYLTGMYIRQKGKSPALWKGLLLSALLLLLTGYTWGLVFPINKKIWTSSYTLVAGGYAIAFLALLIYLIEWRSWKGRWCRFFDIFGKNPLFIFVLSGFIPRILGLIRIANPSVPNAPAASQSTWLSPFRWCYQELCLSLTRGDARAASLLFGLILVLFYWAIGYGLDKKKIYIRV